MEDIILICKYDGERLATQYPSCTSYDKLVKLIREKWYTLTTERLDLLYSTPTLDKFLLKDSDDFSSMIWLASLFSLKMMEIDVKAPFAKKSSTFEIGCSSNSSELLAPVSTNNGLPNERSIVIHSSNEEPLLSAYWGMSISHVGQVFPGGRIELRAALAKYAVKRGFSISYKRNDQQSVIAYCKNRDENTNCPWEVSSSIRRADGYFIIRKLTNHHTCNARLDKEDSIQLSSTMVAGLIARPLASKEKQMTPNDVSHHVKQFYGQDVGYTVAWHALNKAKEEMFGNEADSYQELWWYTRAACETNPGSHIVLELDDNSNRFSRIFVAWGACIEGFRFVRPMLFLDGTFLKGKYKGCLLSATGKNANQELYPLAYAIVDSENGENWHWFLTCLRDILEHDRPITFVSDRNPGLLDALFEVLPEHENFYCLRHLQDNLRGRCTGQVVKGEKDVLVNLFTKCAYALTTTEFYKCLDEFRRVGVYIANDFLKDLPYCKWTNSFCMGRRYGEMTSNAAESFNSWIRDTRDFPITRCIDKVREKLMLWFEERRTKSDNWYGYLCKRMEDKLEGLISDGRTWRVKKAGKLVFEVHADPTQSVNFNDFTCTCNGWRLSGFPCAHAVACVNSQLSLGDYIESYWFVDSYKSSYGKSIMPIPHAIKDRYTFSHDPIIRPPLTKTPPGRPKKQRFKTKGERENKKIIKCSRCNKLGHHNKKSCKASIE